MLKPQSTHRVAMADFWRTFHHYGKISPGCWGWGGGGCTPNPFHSIYHLEQRCSVRSSWAGRYTPRISSLPYMYSVVSTPPLCNTLWLSTDSISQYKTALLWFAPPQHQGLRPNIKQFRNFITQGPPPPITEHFSPRISKWRHSAS
jgi:hypothetical protein